jgi:hypothetical protein
MHLMTNRKRKECLDWFWESIYTSSSQKTKDQNLICDLETHVGKVDQQSTKSEEGEIQILGKDFQNVEVTVERRHVRGKVDEKGSARSNHLSKFKSM